MFLLRDLEELTIGEIAARLGLSVPATKSRLHRARTLAREYLLA
ncbi:RNA polymerase sigma factor [Paraburkholderia diazotrophica]|nr:sigma factor-like helix-turn-helix DNA-binding protein [Paraburkholderia diazotrophica]